MKNPYATDGGFWVRANFHTHTQLPDLYAGKGVPAQDVVDAYERAGYDWLCLSNHDRATDLSVLHTRTIRLLPGMEFSHLNHMLLLGVEAPVPEGKHQQVIDEVAARGGISVVCHPHWAGEDYWPWDELNALAGFDAMEIYDGYIYRDMDGGSGLATDVWDRLMCEGKFVCGIGSDDFHDYIDMGRVYNLLYVKDNSQEALLEAIRERRVCVSTGLEPAAITNEEGMLRVKVRYARPHFRQEFTYRFYADGELVSTQYGEEGAFRFEEGQYRYVRAEAEGENGAKIFLQPMISQ